MCNAMSDDTSLAAARTRENADGSVKSEKQQVIARYLKMKIVTCGAPKIVHRVPRFC